MKKSQLNKLYNPDKEYSILCKSCEETTSLSALNINTYENCANRTLRNDFKPLKVHNNRLTYSERYYKCPNCNLILPDTEYKLIRGDK